MKKPNNIVRIPCTLDNSFFKHWFAFLTPFHKLTERESEIAAALIKYRYELGKVIKDDNILDKVVMGEDTKKKIREECNISSPHFQVILGKLKKNKVIIDGRINPRFIPNIIDDEEVFQLLLYFELK